MNDYEKWLNHEMEDMREEFYRRIEEMLKICREHLSHKIMMELLDAAYPSPSREVERHDNEA